MAAGRMSVFKTSVSYVSRRDLRASSVTASREAACKMMGETRRSCAISTKSNRSVADRVEKVVWTADVMVIR